MESATPKTCKPCKARLRLTGLVWSVKFCSLRSRHREDGQPRQISPKPVNHGNCGKVMMMNYEPNLGEGIQGVDCFTAILTRCHKYYLGIISHETYMRTLHYC